VGFDVHGARASNAHEAAVHFGANAARTGAIGHGRWPEFFLGEFFGHVFGNGQGVPNSQVAIHQHRDFAYRVDVFQALLELGLRIKTIKAHHHFFKGNACLLEHDPWPHRPGRVIFVGDEKFHGRPLARKTSSLVQAPL